MNWYAALDERVGGNLQSRQVNGEDASVLGEIPDMDLAIVRFGPPAAEHETQTQAALVGAVLPERLEQTVGVPTGKAATFILDFDQHPLSTRDRS